MRIIYNYSVSYPLDERELDSQEKTKESLRGQLWVIVVVVRNTNLIQGVI